ncbi:MAG: cupredoxin domain-containing protein [Alphaproteobacteria bacterium]|nr:cupredoxin domain-containing protein [Alphaproteobacteria bacterium]
MTRPSLRLLFPAMVLLAAAPAFAASVVVQKGRAFRPAEITINRGETVTFTNDDSYIHQVYVKDLFDSPEKAPGENLNETFPTGGTFQVRCHIHPTMKMTVRVR